METKKIEIGENSVKRLVGFFNLLGYEEYARELDYAWQDYAKKLHTVLYLHYINANTVDEMDTAIKERIAEYKNALANIKKAFNYYASKTAVMTQEGKWRRSAI